MLQGEGIGLLDVALELIGAFVGLSIAYIAIRGYRETGSPTLLRLSSAFLFLFAGFVFEALAGIGKTGFFPSVAIAVTAFALAAGFLQATGYFFLAFSHILNVRGRLRMSGMGKFAPLVAPIGMPALQVAAVLGSLSFYFLLYGSIETCLSYIRHRRSETLVICVGLVLIALSEFVRWISFFYYADTATYLVSLIIKILGFVILFVPVVKYASKKEDHRDGLQDSN